MRRAVPIASMAALTLVLGACSFWDLGDWSDRYDAREAQPEGGPSVEVPGVDASVEGGPEVLASDNFERKATDGLGLAIPTGGAWDVRTNSADVSVQNGVGRFALNPADGPRGYLKQVVTDDADVSFDVSVDRMPSNGYALYASVVSRLIDESIPYNGRVVIRNDGSVTISMSLGSTTGEMNVANQDPQVQKRLFTIQPNDVVRARFQATSTNPTHLRMKAWQAKDPEPTDWTLQADDSNAALQAKGNVGFSFYLSAESIPLVATIDNFYATHARP